MPGGRPRKPDAMTAAERQLAQRQAGWRAVRLSPASAADLAAVRQRDGDPTDVAVVARLLRDAASGGG